MLTLHDRRKCKQCRYQRCIGAGMNPELVLTEDQKQIRFRKLLLKKKKGPTTPKRNSNTSSSASVAASAHSSGYSADQTQSVSVQPRPRKTERSERSANADDLSCEQDAYFDLDIFLDEVSTNEVCKDEVSNDEMSNDEVSNDEMSNDKAAKIVALYKAAIQQQTGGQTSEVFKSNLFSFIILFHRILFNNDIAGLSPRRREFYVSIILP
jgi:hypothetical protein